MDASTPSQSRVMKAKDLNLADSMAQLAVALKERGTFTTVEAAQLLTFHTLDRLPTKRRRVLIQRARRAMYRLSRFMPITVRRDTFWPRHLHWKWEDEDDDEE